ncbi:unnamed protein product [Euphydryas editha]|uniref:Rad60/SUMO-like domain-containing protein n=1 Tax=Euphydryas editha TaxID=104508 RepID=A0AAU9TER9_EUPED|nr:unnamed protein product [Euphydryas editha]
MSLPGFDHDFYGNTIKKPYKLPKIFEARADSILVNKFENKSDITINSSVSKRGKTKRKSVGTSKPNKRTRKSERLSNIKSTASISNDILKNDVNAKIDAFIDLTEIDSLWPTNNINDKSKFTRSCNSAKSEQNEPSNNDVILIDSEDECSTSNDNIPLSSLPRSDSRGQNATKTRRSSRKRGTPKGQRICKNSSRTPVTRSQNKSRHSNINGIPTFSIGNTDEYNDELEYLQIFSSERKKDSISNKQNLTDDINSKNEELSVMVYWQNLYVQKFTIRRFQKIKVIYDFFSEKENIPINNLIFMYNNSILSPDDSPDSIDYNIVKFIDGGVLNDSQITDVETNVVKKSGIKLKFQSQKFKKPFVTYSEKDESLSLAMIKCAEHLELPLNKLKFEFDGETLSGSETLRSLDMEGGECIDVKIID